MAHSQYFTGLILTLHISYFNFDAWGRKRNASTWTYTNVVSVPDWLYRGYTGHEHLTDFGIINMNARLYDPVLGRMLSPDNFVGSGGSQAWNRYSYANNNPLKFVDPDGNFVTWSIGNGGFSIGFNLTPIGIPLGVGVNIGWGKGFSTGIYGEVGYRVGGTGFGSGVTISQSLNYNFGQHKLSTATSFGAYASIGPVNASINFGASYDIADKQWSSSWGVGVGVGIGNDERGIGLSIGYGSDGFTYGLGGYYNSKAWDSNPEYNPSDWNDDVNTLKSNNCYSYACDDPNNHPYGGKPQPGESSGQMYTSIDLTEVSDAAIRDGLKKPNIFNKMGFGKKGYYSVYLVIDENKDYHWYRQDKRGYWSHKPGHALVRNFDASGNLIKNPSRANHNYGQLNYNNGGRYLWVRKKMP